MSTSTSTPLSREEAARITEYLSVHDVPSTTADLAFVFGTRFPDPMTHVIDLLRRGVVPFVVLTGGVNRQTGIVESHAHRDLLLRAGISDRQIIVEDQSTNTLENVVLAVSQIAPVLPPTAVGSLVVIAKWHHCRRAMMTLKRHWPSPVSLLPQLWEMPGVPRQGWWKSDASCTAVLKEWQAIPRYLALEHITEISWEGDAYC